jgi:cytochrome c oxidase subunit 2
VFAAPAEATVFGPRGGHSPNADDIRTAYWIAITVAVLLLVAVHVFLIAAIFRFRADRGRTPRRFSAGPGALTRPLAPLAVVASGLFVVGIVLAGEARDVEPTGPENLASSKLVAQVGALSVPPDAEPLTIDAIGQQWLWRFEYPGNDPQTQPLFSYGELVVPVDTTVILDITSTDVMHSWWIPSLGGQVQAVPGTTSQTWFKADEEGVYEGPSTTFSGTSFPAMRAWVRVVSPENYQAYLDDLKQELTKAGEIVQRQVTQGTGPAGVTP